MAMELRKTGIGVVGDAPWGTHFCHFYETKQDLLDTLVPYFKVGLESREFCVWVISNSELFTVEEAKGALAQAVPDLDRHLSNENIEILNGLDWYLDKNVFNLQRVTSAWDAKLKRALARGYDGLRVSGDTFWLGKKDWKDFCSYEKQVNDSISDRRITLLCTYPLAKSGAAEILDVVQTHQFATARRKGEWEVIETPELAQATAEIRRLNEELEQRVIERTSELRVANEELRKEIAEREQAEVLLNAKENALQESQRRLEEAQRIAHVGHYEHDLETGVIVASDENYRILGIQPQDSFTLSHAFELIHPDDRARVHQERNEAVRAGQHFEVEFRIVRPDGEVRYIHSQGDVIRDEQGRPRRTFGIAQDITDRKQAEDALRRSEDHLRLIIDTIPTMAWTIRPDGTVDFLNQRWMDYTGLSLEQFVKAPTAPIHPEDIPGVLEKWRAQMAVEEGYENEVRLRRADGEYRWFLVRTAPLHDEDGNLVKWYGVSIDIEDRKQAEEKLKETSDQLRALSARLESAREEEGTRIARELHDELGSALTSLKFDLELIKRDGFSSGSDADFSRLREKTETMMQLVDRTIDTVRRISSELRPSALDDIGLVAAIRWQAHQIEIQAGIVCHCEFHLKDVDLDQLQSTALFRVFQEAMTNVLRHARAGRVDITLQKEQNELVMIIRDNGRGITAEEESDRRSLGLLGMRERVNLIGGTIHITGAEGKGTVIKVSVPL